MHIPSVIRFVRTLAVAAAAAALPAAASDIVGDEIVVGTVSDLSGPIALLGVPVRDGMLMRFDEANAAGGVHGRRIRLVVEDAGYDPKRGVLAARKLVQRDNAFAFIANMGTPVVMATMRPSPSLPRASRITAPAASSA